MKNVFEVLRQKEIELARLEKEVEALRVAAPLLSDEIESLAEAPKPSLTAAPPQQPVRLPPVPQRLRAVHRCGVYGNRYRGRAVRGCGARA